jgi:hypothetical protein
MVYTQRIHGIAKETTAWVNSSVFSTPALIDADLLAFVKFSRAWRNPLSFVAIFST